MMRALTAIIFATSVLVGAAAAQGIAPSVEQPSVTRAVAPLFPIPKDKSFYAVGSVNVEIQIDARGIVIKARAVQGHPFLYAASEKAAQRWLFAPASGETKIRTARLTFVFKMIEDPITEEDLSSIFLPPHQIEVRRKTPVITTSET
jgi:hypothetical protein